MTPRLQEILEASLHEAVMYGANCDGPLAVNMLCAGRLVPRSSRRCSSGRIKKMLVLIVRGLSMSIREVPRPSQSLCHQRAPGVRKKSTGEAGGMDDDAGQCLRGFGGSCAMH
jgi:hypothetical protein